MKAVPGLILTCALMWGCATPPPKPPEVPSNLATAPVIPTPPSHPRPLDFPARTATSLITPDGRSWQATYTKAETDDRYQLEFELADRTPDQPLEKLSFSITNAQMSKSQLTRAMSDVQAKFDPLLVHAFAGDDDAFTLTYSSPGYNEHAVWRVVRHGARYAAVVYRERRGASGAAALAYWTRTIGELPDSYFAAALANSDGAPALGAANFSDLLVQFQPREGDQSHTSMEIISKVDQSPQMRFRPNADFKYPAWRRGETVQVVLELEVAEDGRVADAFVLKTSLPEAGEAMAAAYKKGKFRPALVDGKPAVCRLRLQVDFVL